MPLTLYINYNRLTPVFYARPAISFEIKIKSWAFALKYRVLALALKYRFLCFAPKIIAAPPRSVLELDSEEAEDLVALIELSDDRDDSELSELLVID